MNDTPNTLESDLAAVDVAADEFAADIETIRSALRVLAARAESGDLAEIIGGARIDDNTPLLHHDAFAQLLMEALPMGATKDARLSLPQKLYWASVAEYLGPDWLEAYRVIGAFMTKVEGF